MPTWARHFLAYRLDSTRLIAVPIASHVFNGAVDRACVNTCQHRGLKWWQPTLDSNSLPAKFHNILRMKKVQGRHNSLEGLERLLRDAGQQGGNRENTYLRLQPSDGLKRLRAQRRATMDTQLRKSLTIGKKFGHGKPRG